MAEELDEKKKRAMVNRISKVIGHTKHVKDMVERGDDCSEVLIQLAAVRSAINNAGKEILKAYMSHSVQEAVEEKDMEKIKKLNRDIEIFMK